MNPSKKQRFIRYHSDIITMAQGNKQSSLLSKGVLNNFVNPQL